VEWAQASVDQYLVDPLCEGGAAVLLEARGIEHPITENGIVEFSLDDPRAHGLGGHLESDVGGSSAIPLAVPHQRAAREQSIRAALCAGRVVVVRDDCPPSH
jgi:hypothetical protein